MTKEAHRPFVDVGRRIGAEFVAACQDCRWAQVVDEDLHEEVTGRLLEWHVVHPEQGFDHLSDRDFGTFAFDEFGPLGIRPAHGTSWAPQGRPDRLPATYHRTHGTTYLHGCYSVGDDTLWGVNRRRKGIAPTWAAWRSIRAARPDGAPIYVILDNLSAHKNWRIRTWARRHKVELCFTPTYASWANPIEAHFGPLRQFIIANSDHPNHTVQTRALHAYLRWRNANARHPTLLAAQRRKRARVRSEKGIRFGGRPLPLAA